MDAPSAAEMAVRLSNIGAAVLCVQGGVWGQVRGVENAERRERSWETQRKERKDIVRRLRVWGRVLRLRFEVRQCSIYRRRGRRNGLKVTTESTCIGRSLGKVPIGCHGATVTNTGYFGLG